MILVSGSERADALSVAMGLHDGGLHVLGAPIPTSLEDCLSSASDWWLDVINGGVFFETNPRADRYLFPDQTKAQVAVVDPLGVAKTDPAYLDRVVVVVRPWQSAEDPAYWLRAIYEQLADSSLRRYPTWFVTRERLSASPGVAARSIGEFLSSPLSLDVDRMASVFRRLPPTSPRHTSNADSATMDELYGVLHAQAELSDDLVARLNEALSGDL